MFVKQKMFSVEMVVYNNYIFFRVTVVVKGYFLVKINDVKEIREFLFGVNILAQSSSLKIEINQKCTKKYTNTLIICVKRPVLIY